MSETSRFRPVADASAVRPILRKISILGGLSDTQVDTVCRVMESGSFTAGERIFEQGACPSYIYVVRSGRIKIVVDIDDEPLELIEYTDGDCFGETSAIGIEPHSATAVAVVDSALVVLSSKALHELYRTDAPLFGMLILNIAREACRRLHRTDQIMLHYAMGKAGRHSRQTDAAGE